MSHYEWTPKKNKAVIMLAQGHKIEETAEAVGVAKRTILRWKGDIEFMQEMDRLSLMMDVANRSERLRIAMRYIRKLDSKERTNKDILDWIRFAQSETQGARVDLTDIIAAISEAGASVAGSESAGTEAESDQETDDTD